MIDLLRKYTPQFMQWYRVAWQVQSVLAKILLCRTAVLKGHIYRCPGCQSEKNVYNSCADRHCPQCRGARRADWLSSTRRLLLPGVTYFQVIFTLPDHFSPLILGNRKPLYDLLFHSAWQALDEELRRTGRFRPAALMVLHTWNQELDHHPHLHALVPGGGPSLDDGCWIRSRHPTQLRRRKPYLTNNEELGQVFREKFVAGFRRLVLKGQLRLEGQWARLRDPAALDEWLERVIPAEWNVFIEGPPHGKSDPAQVLKYLARYMTGGPISDRRIHRDDEEGVTFWARSKDRANRSRPFTLRGKEFVRRWSLHILPKGYTRSRCYGGYHGSKREAYLRNCRESQAISEPTAEQPEPIVSRAPTCLRCELEMEVISSQRRPSWRQVFERDIYRDSSVYSPIHHLGSNYGFAPSAHDPYG